MSSTQFRSHFSTLWEYFRSNYQSTLDSYTVGFSQLVLQNKALDIALIALGTQRLAVSAGDKQMQLMSWTAYHHSLRLYREVMRGLNSSASSTTSNASPISSSGSESVFSSVDASDVAALPLSSHPSLAPTSDDTRKVLFAISFVFTLFEGAQQTPTKIYSSTSENHLHGALAILKLQDPSLYSQSGYHEVFRKCRELAIHHALSSRQSTFLSEARWRAKPWIGRKKLWRDKLHDTGVQMTEIMTYVQRVLPSQRHPDKSKTRFMQEACRGCWIELINWRDDWLRKAYPKLHIICTNSCSICYCSLPPASFPDSDFAHLQVEQWAFLLLLGMLARTLELGIDYCTPYLSGWATEELVTNNSSTHSPSRPNIISDLIGQVPFLADLIDRALHEPFYGQVLHDTPGITEGRCRSLFPLWTLMQYREYREPANGAAIEEIETGWWSNLGTRLNVGEGMSLAQHSSGEL
jgi:hypothetical protein